MKNLPRSARLRVLIGALFCALAISARAQITLTPTITDLGNGLIRYEYSVVNASLFDFSAISLNVIAMPTTVHMLMAPTGFNAFFDPGLGEVDFVENTQTFAAQTTVSGFAFTSPFAPQLSPFTALRLDLNGNPVTITGVVLAPATIPEPATMALLGGGIVTLVAMEIIRRRRPK